LLIAVLKLLDRAGQLAQCTFHPVETHGKVAGIGLHGSTARCGLTRLWLFAAVEKVVEKVAGTALILRRRSASQKQNGNCGKHRSSR